MNYQETIQYLFTKLPMFQRVGPVAYKKDLDNTLALCAHLGNPHQQFPSIHVAGTNGKGSVSHMLAAACQQVGLKTGLYTSPHYRDFRERIKINGQLMPKQQVVRFVTDHQAFIEQLQPSFFELTVGLAFDYFAREKVDIAIVEVGLGGRLDSTNVITPLLSVITNISFDHVDLLGDTLEKIAGEKAGIIKPGVPVVVGETQMETRPVFSKKARETGSAIYFADQHYAARPLTNQPGVFEIEKDGKPWLQMPIGAAGPYQSKNLATVLQALEVVVLPPKAAPLTNDSIVAALDGFSARMRFVGRWQLLSENPRILADSAHNEAGVRMVFEQIKNEGRDGALHIVCGFVSDKDLSHVLGLFPGNAKYYFAKANVPRGMDAKQLRTLAAGNGLNGRAYSSVTNALKAAKRASTPKDTILVIGSIFVVAEVI